MDTQTQPLDRAQATEAGNSAEHFALALRQALTYDQESGLDKHFWLDVSELIGQTACQDFYHAAVFCTKVSK